MRPLDELIDDRSGAELLIRWIEEAAVPVQVLDPSSTSGDQLHSLQVTTRSPLGAIVYSTGGLLIDGGWLRVLGSGSDTGVGGLRRSLTDWNDGRAEGFLLIADDAAGGFFAADGGGLGGDPGEVHYQSPDDVEWEPLGLGYSEFLVAMLGGRLGDFAADLRWDGWRNDVATMAGDDCVTFYPFLWSKEGSPDKSERRVVPIAEEWDARLNLLRQLADSGEEE